MRRLDLVAELRHLVESSTWQTRGHAAATLVKTAYTRIVLIAMKSGARIQAHRAQGRVSIHVVVGRIRLRAGEDDSVLAEHQLAMLPAGLEHDLNALEESAVLLTIAWPPSGAAATTFAPGSMRDEVH